MVGPAFRMQARPSGPIFRMVSHRPPKTAGPAALSETPRCLLQSSCILRACVPPNSHGIRGPTMYVKVPRLIAETPVPLFCFQRETKYRGPRTERVAVSHTRQWQADKNPAESHCNCEEARQTLLEWSGPRVRTKRAWCLLHFHPHRTVPGFLASFVRIACRVQTGTLNCLLRVGRLDRDLHVPWS